MPVDPSTSRPLPDSAIQRITFVTPTVHVYTIPPLTSNRGFSAAPWTSPPHPTAQQIFTARVRIFETSIESNLKVDVVLEDPNSGELFAAAPYKSEASVQQANDSSRFFAIRVEGEGGMRATLGIGFEDRATALDFNIALAEAKKVLGLGGVPSGEASKSSQAADLRQDFSLKEGQKIKVRMGSRGDRPSETERAKKDGISDGEALFSIAPPPPAAARADIQQKAQHDLARTDEAERKSAQDLGFDDGEFGEFQ